MDFSCQVSRLLDDEHRHHLELMDRVELAVSDSRRREPMPTALMRQFARALEHDLQRHFQFEEESLFPLLTDAGDGEMAALLAEEHDAIRELAARLLPLAQSAAAGTLDDGGWKSLRADALEMVERQVSHIQKESMALLPMLQDLLDEDTDRELAFAYATP